MSDENYGVSAKKSEDKINAPDLAYLPAKPKNYNPSIAIIGAGNISAYHLEAYQLLDLNVVAVCNRNIGKAQEKQAKFFPNATAHDEFQEILSNDTIGVVDITTHPEHRLHLIEAALKAGKHVLSQKPFVTDLADGERLIKLAKENNVQLAVNQNGRWAPHFRYITLALDQGLIGNVTTIDFSLQWDQTWIAGNEGFESIKHMVLYDFAIHWFDITCRLMNGRKPKSVYASVASYPEQIYRPAALAHAVIDYEGAQVRMNFNAHNTFGEEDSTTVAGTKGLIRSRGSRLTEQTVTLYTDSGIASPDLQGHWFINGFQGTMCELLNAIEENREPENSAANNLDSLALCFAALKSADSGQPTVPGTVGSL